MAKKKSVKDKNGKGSFIVTFSSTEHLAQVAAGLNITPEALIYSQLAPIIGQESKLTVQGQKKRPATKHMKKKATESKAPPPRRPAKKKTHSLAPRATKKNKKKE